MKLHSFTVTDTINAPIKKVFTALTNSKELVLWSGKGIIEPKKGGAFSMFDGWVKGTVLVFNSPKKITYTWKPSEWQDSWAPSVVTYTLMELGDVTKLTIKHEKLPSAKEAKEHKQGWFDHVIHPLQEYLR